MPVMYRLDGDEVNEKDSIEALEEAADRYYSSIDTDIRPACRYQSDCRGDLNGEAYETFCGPESVFKYGCFDPED